MRTHASHNRWCTCKLDWLVQYTPADLQYEKNFVRLRIHYGAPCYVGNNSFP